MIRILRMCPWQYERQRRVPVSGKQASVEVATARLAVWFHVHSRLHSGELCGLQSYELCTPT